MFYTYPFEHLHITVATLANFKTGPLAEGAPGADSAARDRATAAWRSALERAFVAGGQPTGFLNVNRPKVDAQAAFFPVSDLDSAIGRARQTLAAQIPLVAQHQVDTSARSVNLPDIVHSTFARYRRAPSDPQALALRLEADLLPAWPAHGVRVPVSTFSLVVERAAYMHVAQSRETIVAQFPTLYR